MLAALNRFISKFTDCCRPFYQLLKKWTGFQWNEECDKTFQDLKDYLVQAPMLTAPKPTKDLFMYLAMSEHAASVMLLRGQGIQQPVYYISKTLVDSEIRYLPLERLVLALIHATRKLPHYFQAHTVYVLTEYTLQSLLKRSDFTRRIAKWGTRLGSFDIRCKLRSSVKGQVLVDFVAEFSPKNNGEIVFHMQTRPWKVFMDEASSSTGADTGIVIITSEGIRLEHSYRSGFKASNNDAEYKGLLAKLRTISSLGNWDVEIYSDSCLVVNQVQGSFEAQDPWMKANLERMKQAVSSFRTVKVIQVAQSQNRHADSLSMLASIVTKEIPRLIKVKLVQEPSIKVANDLIAARINVTAVSTLGPCWIDPIVNFLTEDRVPLDEKEASKIHKIAPRYWLSEDRKLYQRSLGGRTSYAYT
nr:uncharacterized protein LOC112033961 [Quercus suber]